MTRRVAKVTHSPYTVSMAVSMVANPYDSKITVGDLAKSLVKLKLTENKKHTRNMVEWDEALRAVYSTNELAMFTNKYYGIQLPSGMVPKSMLQGQVQELLKAREQMLKTKTTQQVVPVPPTSSQAQGMQTPLRQASSAEVRRSARIREREERAQRLASTTANLPVDSDERKRAEREEAAAVAELEREIADQEEERRQQTATVSQQRQQQHINEIRARNVSAVNTPAPIPRDVELQKQFEAEMLKNANEIMADQVKADAVAEKRGNRNVTFFANPLSKSTYSTRHLFEGCEYEIEWPKGSGSEYYYALESAIMRKKRHVSWQLLLNSLSNLNSAIWKHVPIGDVHGLYTLITTRYDDQDRTDVVEKLNGRLHKLEKYRNELYATFLGRYEQLIIEMAEVQMDVDTDVMKQAVMRAHERSSDEMLKGTYDIVTAMLFQQHGGNDSYTVDELLNMMRPMMVSKERAAGKQDRQDGASRAQRQREKREKQKALKAAARATANAAKADLAPLPDHLKNVCVEFNLGKCPKKGNMCRWSHVKKSPEEVAVLQEYVQVRAGQRKAAQDGKQKGKIVCYGCGQEGHIKPKCPKKDKANLTKPTAKELVNTASIAIADHQVEAFAEALLKFRQNAEQKE